MYPFLLCFLFLLLKMIIFFRIPLDQFCRKTSGHLGDLPVGTLLPKGSTGLIRGMLRFDLGAPPFAIGAAAP